MYMQTIGGRQGVASEQSLHSPRQVRSRGLDQQVAAVVHDDEAEHLAARARHRVLQVSNNAVAILVVLHDFLPAVGPGDGVIDCPVEFDAESSRYPGVVTPRDMRANEKREVKPKPSSSQLFRSLKTAEALQEAQFLVVGVGRRVT
jgi:hypothetical protein